jgi:2-polyprenyl-3-methyl-5-hydroxy-6-metoxy-1,4-benzoquinol methylase
MATAVPADVKQRLKASYDAIADKYNDWTLPHSEHRLKYLGKLLSLLDATGPASETTTTSVLELGCGCGLPVSQTLLRHGDHVRVTANDLSSTQIALAREKLLQDETIPNVAQRLELLEGDMSTLSFADGQFDAVVAMYSLIHLPLPEQGQILDNIAKWLKPGGYLLANFSEQAAEAIVTERWLDDKGWGFWSGLGAEGTLQKIKTLGLEVLVGEVEDDAVDASFLWVVAKKAG